MEVSCVLCLVSPRFDVYEQAELVPAIVPTNIVLSSLVHVSETNTTRLIKQQAAHFLLTEKNEYWSFNYWFRRSEWYTKEPYPDDLDDTFCALAALAEYDPSLFDGQAMAKIVLMLTSAEKATGGPYDMWLVPPEERKTWNDTDLVVNSNIAFFLSLQQISLPNVQAFIERSIEEERYEFPYTTCYPAMYFISRFYRGVHVPRMVDRLLTRQESDGKWENPLRTALAISALVAFSGNQQRERIEKGIAYLRKTQAEDGSWPAYSFFFQCKTSEKTLYAGSASITTALCLEAFQRWSSLRAIGFEAGSHKTGEQATEQYVYEQVIQRVRARFSGCGPEVQAEAERALMELSSDRQIALLPHVFRQSLGEAGRAIPDTLVILLGAATLFGWLAYTAYDDFLDEEGDPTQVSPANICLREAVELFRSVVPADRGFASVVRRVFDEIDSANAWEIAHSPLTAGSLPDYGDAGTLARRSFGHALAPIALLFFLGYTEHSIEVQTLQRFFEAYLIARQLNDDAHDWETDLQRGRINMVATWIALDGSLDQSRFAQAALEELRQVFWRTTIVKVCTEIERHLTRAKAMLAELSLVTEPKMLLHWLVPIEDSIAKARRERQETLNFLESYQAQPEHTSLAISF